MQAIEQTVAGLIEPSLTAMGYELVRVRLSGGRHPTLQIMAEPANGGPMTVDDCADISRAVSAILDVEDPVPDAYTLEVSSPGIDRPLTRLKDFERYAGFDARIELNAPIDGRRRFSGRLDGVSGEAVEMTVQEGGNEIEVTLPYGEIQKAKLLLTDALIAAEEERLKPQSSES